MSSHPPQAGKQGSFLLSLKLMQATAKILIRYSRSAEADRMTLACILN